VSGGDVLALAASGDNIFLGGDFTAVGTAARKGVASLTSAAALRDWDAKLNTGAEVHALAASSDTVYLGGSFDTSVGSRSNLVALTTSDATIPSNWALTAVTGGTSTVEALALDGTTTLYLGGGFGTVGSGRSRLAAVDASTGALGGWNPGADAVVRALAIVGDNVVAGGEFTTIGSASIFGIGAVPKASNSAVSWDPLVAGPAIVLSLATGTGNALFAGGEFTTVGMTPNNNHDKLVVFDSMPSPYALMNAQLGDVNTTSGGVYALLNDSGILYVGGKFSAVGGNRCNNFCAIPYTPDP
jgi:hypothetical protein